MSRQPLVDGGVNEPAASPPSMTYSPPPSTDIKGLDYRPSYVKKTPEVAGSGSGVNSSTYSPPYILSSAGSPRDNMSVILPGSAGYGEHTTDYSTHSSNSQGNTNGPWTRHEGLPPNTVRPGVKMTIPPHITINPTSQIQNNLLPPAGSHVVTQQPKSVTSVASTSDHQEEWSTGICQCCDGTNTCFAICCCLPCFECWLADRMQEGCCMPWCVPASVMALRMKVRLQNNIRGSILGDFCAASLCCPCVLCQIKRELDYREAKVTVQRPSNIV